MVGQEGGARPRHDLGAPYAGSPSRGRGLGSASNPSPAAPSEARGRRRRPAHPPPAPGCTVSGWQMEGALQAGVRGQLGPALRGHHTSHRQRAAAKAAWHLLSAGPPIYALRTCEVTRTRRWLTHAGPDSVELSGWGFCVAAAASSLNPQVWESAQVLVILSEIATGNRKTWRFRRPRMHFSKRPQGVRLRPGLRRLAGGLRSEREGAHPCYLGVPACPSTGPQILPPSPSITYLVLF